ncbi:chorismate mutase [Sanguibacter antarcticus]|uniref:chorismate mutase n=1 Tax=Sanguibacter antarcticus TaxID=372484 RepID=UPI001FE6F843|nr:chorismate mutase [Sanguibacter antarcticus]
MTSIGGSAPDPATERAPLDDPTQNPAIRAEILRLRGSIDNIDAALMHLLAERFKCTQRVGELKAEGGVAPADPARESHQIETLARIAEGAGLDPAFAEQFRAFIVHEVIRRHELIASEQGGSRTVDTYS